MVFATLVFLISFNGIEAPALSEITECAEGAAFVEVVSISPCDSGPNRGNLVTCELIEHLWGTYFVKQTFWTPASACTAFIEQGRYIMGYTAPNEKQRELFQLPPDVLFVCGVMQASSEDCAAVLKLKQGGDFETLSELLDHDNVRIRRQGLRCCSRRLPERRNGRKGSGGEKVAALLEKARSETDPELLETYFQIFRAHRRSEAMPMVIRELLNTSHTTVAASAEQTFHHLARRTDVEALAAQYHRRNRGQQKRILRALAPRGEPAAGKILQKALQREDELLSALEALHFAGKELPASLPEISNPAVRRKVHRFLNLIERERTIGRRNHTNRHFEKTSGDTEKRRFE